MVLEIALLAFVVALLRGGRFRALADLKLNHLWLAVIPPVVIFGLALMRWLGCEAQVLRLSSLLHVFSLAVWAAFLWFNRMIAGTGVLALGVFLNFWPVVFNSGNMPVSREMSAAANMGPQIEKYISSKRMERHCWMSDNTRFNWLADWIPIRKPPFYLSAGVASPGDLIVTAGIFVMIQSFMGVPLRKSRK